MANMAGFSKKHFEGRYLSTWLAYFIGIIVFLIVCDVAMLAPDFAGSEFVKKFQASESFSLVREIMQEAPSVFIAILLGGMGASARMFVERLSIKDSDQLQVEPGDRSFDRATARELIYTELGGVSGLIGYVVVKSKVLLKLLYSNSAAADVTSTWHGIAFVSIFWIFCKRTFRIFAHFDC